MAVISCPECGHQVSDKAPTCPNCGVEIVGKVTQCRHCGKAVLVEDSVCRHCGKAISGNKPDAQANVRQTLQNKPQRRKKKESNSLKPYVIIVILTLLISLFGLYYYKSNKEKREETAYEMAMRSTDPTLLQNFLNNFADASKEHIDSIKARLDYLNMIDDEWENVRAMKSKTALQDYLAKYPGTNHKGEIENMLDSMDWEQAVKSNNNDMYQQYINEHPYGKHADDARDKISELKAKTVQPEERHMIVQLMRKFFISVNKHDENGLLSTLSPQMTSFIGLSNPTEMDVKRWMDKLYSKEGVSEIIWRLNNDYIINKREVGDDAYEYTAKFSASEDIKYTDNAKSVTEHYHITANITPDGELSAMSINKIINSNE